MKFRTEYLVSDAPRNLSPERLILLAGSCFSDNIGARMQWAGWPAIANPCGVIYNPVSMALLFRLALMQRAFRREIISSSITTRDIGYVSWFVSSKACGTTPEEAIEAACECIEHLEEGIEKADAIILTFGTSDVWLLADTDRAVGNCHKHPSSEFYRTRVPIEEIVAAWKEIIEALRERNPGVKIIFTVSPRRYLSDGFAENSRQKAVLILACEELAKIDGVYYFPAYEILNDDLRDYRFYASDLLHPSESAIEYIWEKFTETYLTPDGMKKLKEMEREARRRNHRK